MNYGQIPFSQWEADIAVYLSDASGNVAAGAAPMDSRKNAARAGRKATFDLDFSMPRCYPKSRGRT